MKLRAPLYYKDFKCIADKCKKSCCSAGWEIDIDSETENYYNTVDGEFGKKLKSNIILNDEGTCKTFKLDKNNNCPFLNGKKLCDIYINLGEEHLCNICAEHPRFYEWFKDFKEVGIGLCCEESARIILSQTQPFSTYEIDIPYEDCDEYDDEIYSYLFKIRNTIINHLNNVNLLQNPRNLNSSIRDLIWYCNVIQQNINSGLLDNEEIFEISNYQKSDISPIFDFILTFDANNETWKTYLQKCKQTYSSYSDKFSEFENSNPEIYTYLKNISIYFIWRYFLKGVFDEEIISKFNLMAISISILKVLFFCKWLENGSLSLNDCIDITTQFSEEIEYSENNIIKLADACYDLDEFSVEALMGLF